MRGHRLVLRPAGERGPRWKLQEAALAHATNVRLASRGVRERNERTPLYASSAARPHLTCDSEKNAAQRGRSTSRICCQGRRAGWPPETMAANFMCQPVWAKGCPDIWGSTFRGVSVRMSLEGASIRSERSRWPSPGRGPRPTWRGPPAADSRWMDSRPPPAPGSRFPSSPLCTLSHVCLRAPGGPSPMQEETDGPQRVGWGKGGGIRDTPLVF